MQSNIATTFAARGRWLACALLLIGCFAGTIFHRGTAANAQEAGGKKDKPLINYRDPPREYQDFRSGAWQVKIEKQMLDEDPALAQRALTRLEQKLAFMLTLLPAHSHAQLQQVPIFLMFGSRARGGGEDTGANYHQKNAPNAHPHLDPRWGNSIVIKSAQNYATLSEFWSVKVLLHEFGHAWHLMHWPEKQPEILTPWQNATDRGLYQNVKDAYVDKQYDRAYALTNQMEYFAELTCMYFCGCNYPPLNRRELQLYDPAGYAMIETAWSVSADGKSDKPEAKKPKAETARAKPKSPPASNASGTTTAAVPKEYRTWTDPRDNSKLEAQFAGLAGGNVRLKKKDGSVVTIPLGELIAEDQEWIRSRRRNSASPSNVGGTGAH